jgi:hypothetical protein
MGCGPAPLPEPPTEPELREISQARALDEIRGVLEQAGVDYQRGWSIDIDGAQPLEVDFRLSGSKLGIEWVSPQDRADYGDALPTPDPDGQLRVLPGADADANAQVLILDHRTYEYSPDPEDVQRGALGIRAAESRLRRDVRDFLEYCRGQGAI